MIEVAVELYCLVFYMAKPPFDCFGLLSSACCWLVGWLAGAAVAVLSKRPPLFYPYFVFQGWFLIALLGFRPLFIFVVGFMDCMGIAACEEEEVDQSLVPHLLLLLP